MAPFTTFVSENPSPMLLPCLRAISYVCWPTGKKKKLPLHWMFLTIESLEFLHWRGSQVGRGDEKDGRLVQSYVSSWHTFFFNLYLCLLGDWVMENMGERRFLHLTVFWYAPGYSLQLPTYSLCALLRLWPCWIHCFSERMCHSPTSNHSCLIWKSLYSISIWQTRFKITSTV